MSVVDASARSVELPADEAFAESTADDVIVVEGLRMRYGTTEAVSG
jgi:hypothetical protein